MIPEIGNTLRSKGHDVYDDWFAGGREADDEWQRYEEVRGRDYITALNGWHAAQVFTNDLTHLDRCEAAILVLPAGKSGHLELGYVRGSGKKAYILMDKAPDRFDVMYRYAKGGVYTSLEDLVNALGSVQSSVPLRVREGGYVGSSYDHKWGEPGNCPGCATGDPA